MDKIFRVLDDIPKGKRQITLLLVVVGVLQFLDYLTTRIAVNLNGGGAVELNPLVRGFVSDLGLEFFLLLKIGLVCLLTYSMLRAGRYLFDFWVVGNFVFGFLFVVLNNAVSIFRVLLEKHYGLWFPMVEADILAGSVTSLARSLVLGIIFSLLGIYIYQRYKRTFCLGLAMMFLYLAIFSVINILTHS